MRDRTEDQITLVLIRHGATNGNREHRYVGRTNEELSAVGREELLRYKGLRRYPAVDRLFCSPMRRCLQTAELLYPQLPPVLIPEWTEMDFGAFEGKNHLELQGDRRYQEWIDSNGTLPFPQGESREEFIRRCDRGWKRVLAELKKPQRLPYPGHTPSGAAGAVVHGGTIMALLSRYGAGDYFDHQVENGGGYVCTWSLRDGQAELTGARRLWQE